MIESPRMPPRLPGALSRPCPSAGFAPRTPDLGPSAPKICILLFGAPQAARHWHPRDKTTSGLG